MSTSDILASIESKSTWLRNDAKSLADFVAMLAVRRDFPTLAEDAMDLAEKELASALRIVRRSRATFNAKPVALSMEIAS